MKASLLTVPEVFLAAEYQTTSYASHTVGVITLASISHMFIIREIEEWGCKAKNKQREKAQDYGLVKVQ